MTYITMKYLRTRGWNDRLVKSLLAEPDERSSEMQKPGHLQPCYLLQRVVEVKRHQPAFTMERKRKNAMALRVKHIMTIT